MKFEIRDPGAIDDFQSPWPTALREELPVQTMGFVPLMKELDGTPHRLDNGELFMGMAGSYQTMERLQKVWTMEIDSLEHLMNEFSDHDITITKSKVVGCFGLLEFEEPPSYASSYS